jgi:putative ABC transport system ATP-binding protein
MQYIHIKEAVKSFGNGEAMVTAIDGVNLAIAQGEFLAIMGTSGAGKSTLLSMLGGLSAPSAGQVFFEGIDIYALKRDKLADFRREFLGFVFQSFQLVPYLNVLENVVLPLAILPMARKEKERLALAALERVGLQDKARRLPNQISGGEQERVAVARAVVNQPPVIFADEPTGNLDSRNSAAIMNLLQQLNQDGHTIVMVTHSAENARYADRIIEVADGRVREGEIGT